MYVKQRHTVELVKQDSARNLLPEAFLVGSTNWNCVRGLEAPCRSRYEWSTECIAEVIVLPNIWSLFCSCTVSMAVMFTVVWGKLHGWGRPVGPLAGWGRGIWRLDHCFFILKNVCVKYDLSGHVTISTHLFLTANNSAKSLTWSYLILSLYWFCISLSINYA